MAATAQNSEVFLDARQLEEASRPALTLDLSGLDPAANTTPEADGSETPLAISDDGAEPGSGASPLDPNAGFGSAFDPDFAATDEELRALRSQVRPKTPVKDDRRFKPEVGVRAGGRDWADPDAEERD